MLAQSKTPATVASGSQLLMPPPSKVSKKQRAKRANSERSDDVNVIGFRSVPTTPNQNRAFAAGMLGGGGGDDDDEGATSSSAGGGHRDRLTESDSDSTYGFDTNWKG